MRTGTRVSRRLVPRRYRSAPYPLPSCNCEVLDKDVHLKKCSKALEKEDWEDAICSVCLEYPHNAVLLLCSSHDKGCRPYMCGTSYRYSNCLDQYEKAYKKVTSPNHEQPWDDFFSPQKCEGMELACPLCRGQVKGWTVVEAARKYLDTKKRTCMQDNCSFAGNFKELRKHVRQAHPSAQPREVDPILEQKWRSLEREREREDVISTIISSMPGAYLVGDYVIERNDDDFDSDDEDEVEDEDEDADEDDDEGSVHSFEMNFEDHSLLDAIFVWQAIGQVRNDRGNGRLGRGRGLSGGSRVHSGVSPTADTRGATVSDGEAVGLTSLSRNRGVRVVSPERRVVSPERRVRRRWRSHQ